LKYDYDELLKRARAQVPEVTLKHERLELPRLFVSMVGMRTIIANFKEVADMLDRDPQKWLPPPHTMMAARYSKASFRGTLLNGCFSGTWRRS
jgi:translation initiation factor 2 beta subunit (eIF-2beta)/eIF-5